MSLSSRLDELIEISNRANLVRLESLDREKAGNDENNSRVEIIRQEAVEH